MATEKAVGANSLKAYMKDFGEMLISGGVTCGCTPFEFSYAKEDIELKGGVSQLFPAMVNGFTEPKKYVKPDSCCGKNFGEACEGEPGNVGYVCVMKDKETHEIVMIFRCAEINPPVGEPGFQKCSMRQHTVSPERFPDLYEKYGPAKFPGSFDRTVTIEGLGPGKGCKAKIEDEMKMGAPFSGIIKTMIALGLDFKDMHEPSVEEFFIDLDLRAGDRTRQTVSGAIGADVTEPLIPQSKRRGSVIDVFISAAAGGG
mmetsp:Transcript_96366/g.171279  ORF Transcript_96366/g.171279 Transcript_96366/m.171279 type:complete len:257 (+) Transcript_96366:69-839(+)